LEKHAAAAIIVVTIGLIASFAIRPSLMSDRSGKIIAFIAFFILPILGTVFGGSIHLKHSTSTQFCLSCHTMEPYGKSLHIDDPAFIPASHFQNNRIPRDQACFTCHTNYTIFGDLHSKIRGFKHLHAYYFKNVDAKLALYEPYNNRECLHCHANARSFEERSPHKEMNEQLVTNQISCLTCHNKTHNVEELDKVKMWKGPGA